MRNKIYSLLFSILAIVACDNAAMEEVPYTISPDVFSATVPQGKTALSGKSSIIWMPSDSLALYGAAGKALAYTTSITEGCSKAEFGGSGATTINGKYVAIYPFCSISSFGEESVRIEVKESQKAVLDSFDPLSAVMIAESTSNELSFHHLAAYIQFTIGSSSPEIRSIRVNSRSGSALSGKADISYGKHEMQAVAEESRSSVSISSVGKFVNGKYCIALLPGAYTQGLDFTFTTTDGKEITRSLESSLSLEKGDMMDMGEVILPTTKYPKLKLMYFNIRTSYSLTDEQNRNGWTARRDACFAMFKDQMPDIAGMNEVKPDQLHDIKSNLNGYSVLESANDDNDGNYIIFNASKIEEVPETSGKFWLSPTPDSPSEGWSGASTRLRTCIYSQFKVKGTSETFWFFVAHTASEDGYDAYKGLELISSRIGIIVPDGDAVFLGGDFNCHPASGPLTAIRKSMANARNLAPLTDSKDTYNNWGEKFTTLDYIFVKGRMSLQEFKTIDSAYSGRPFISDHFPITLECRINTPQQIQVPDPMLHNGLFTSNVSFSEGQTSGSVSILSAVIDGKEYPSMKIGTAEGQGSFTFSPSVIGDFKLSFYAFCWNSKYSQIKVSVAGGSVNGSTCAVVTPRANSDCSSRTSVFNPFESDRYTVDISGISQTSRITISTCLATEVPENHTAEYRSIVFGINTEGGSPRPADDGSYTSPLNPRDDWQNLF